LKKKNDIHLGLYKVLVKPVITKEKIYTRATDKTNAMQLLSFDSPNLRID
jgi:hypothetical protein